MTHYRCLPLLLVPLAFAACDVFDSRLEALARPDMATSPPDLAEPSSLLALADRCSGDVPTLPAEPDEFDVDTTKLANDVSTDITSCTNHPADGNDGFFAIDTTAGERWHFHVHPLTSSVDLALYILPTCDERSCTVARSEDECGAGRDEHLSFIAPNSGRFLVGIDSRAAGGSAFHMLAVRPVCGNGKLEHSESCDDGNTVSGDGCDERCHSELSTRVTGEVEPNDDCIGANVVLLDPAAPSLTVHGRLGGRCDFDTYSVRVPAGGAVQATLLDVTGAACAPTTPAMSLTFLMPDGHTIAGVVKGSDGAGCPAIGAAQTFATGLAEGTYYVRISTNADVATAFDYQLQLQLH